MIDDKSLSDFAAQCEAFVSEVEEAEAAKVLLKVWFPKYDLGDGTSELHIRGDLNEALAVHEEKAALYALLCEMAGVDSKLPDS